MNKIMISASKLLTENRPKAILRATGDDAFGFLQGQFTNELRQAPGGGAIYGLWLNQKGKVVADSHVLGVSEKEFLLVSFGTGAAVIRQRLEDYIVADDVALADETESTGGLLIAGAGSGAVLEKVLGAKPVAGRFLSARNAMVFPGRRLPGENFEIIGPAGTLAGLKERLLTEGFAETSRAELEFVRISAGIPAVPDDIGPGDLPNEGGLEEAAISYTKGCYLGQEVMARLKNLGQVRRRLHLVQGHGTAPAPLAPLYQADKKVGELRSVASRGENVVAFAMLSLVTLSHSAGLSLEPSGPAVLHLARHG